MADKNNFYTVEGTLHTKGETLTFPIEATGRDFYVRRFILEIKSTHKDKTYTELPEFTMLGDAAHTIDDILEGSSIAVTFSLSGKSIPGQNGKQDWHKTELKAIFVKVLGVPDVQANADINPFLDSGSSADGDDDQLPF